MCWTLSKTPLKPTRRRPVDEYLGNTASASWAREHQERARIGFEDFWDPTRGSYVDHILAGQQMPAMSQAAGAVAIVSGITPQERWARIADVITDSSRLVIRSWIGGADGGYDMTKIVEHSQGIYRIDWDVDREIVLAEPFFSYLVHDAVAAAGRADRLPDMLRRWSVFLHDGYDTFGECWGWGTPSTPGAPHPLKTSCGTCSASPQPNPAMQRSRSHHGRAPSPTSLEASRPRTDSSRSTSRTARSASTARSRCDSCRSPVKSSRPMPDATPSACDLSAHPAPEHPHTP